MSHTNNADPNNWFSLQHINPYAPRDIWITRDPLDREVTRGDELSRQFPLCPGPIRIRDPDNEILEEIYRKQDELLCGSRGPEIPDPYDEIMGIDRRKGRKQRDNLPVMHLNGKFYNSDGDEIEPDICILI